MTTIKSLTIIIAISIFFFLTTCPVQGQNQGTGILLSQSKAITEEVDMAALFMEAHKYYQEEKEEVGPMPRAQVVRFQRGNRGVRGQNILPQYFYFFL